MPASPDLALIRNEAIKLAELYARMEFHTRAICESAHLIAQELKHTAPMSDLEGALVQVIRRRPLPVHFEELSAAARNLANEADRRLATETSAGIIPEPDLPSHIPEEVPA